MGLTYAAGILIQLSEASHKKEVRTLESRIKYLEFQVEFLEQKLIFEARKNAELKRFLTTETTLQ